MGWRDKYRAASFRGVSFFVESADSDHGRRQAVHEHAQRDVPYTEDLGRKAREFSVTGYLLGADYDVQRDSLIAACEQAGPGQLIHPYRGELTVVCRGLKVSENSQDGGKCGLSFTFLESGEASYPSTSVDGVSAISSAGNEVTAAAQDGFLSDFLTTGYPAFVLEAASSSLTELADFMSSPGFSLTSDLQAASDFYYEARDIAASAFDLVQQPFQMVTRVVGLLGGVRTAFGGSAFSMLISLFDKYSTSYSGSSATPSRQQQGKNFNAMNTLVRQVAIAEAAKAAVVTESTSVSGTGVVRTASTATQYDSFQAAITTRDALLDRLDVESETTASDDAYTSMMGLRARVVESVPGPDQNLPYLVQYTPRTTLPSLIVAYQLYGDAARADDITARNSPQHPGFLIGDQVLEVLADG